jgi:hypothetical protein
MTGVPITDALIASYWQWVVKLLPSDFNPPGNVINGVPTSSPAFLCDPTDAPNGYSQNTNGKLGSTQQVLIPLFIAAADIQCSTCNTTLPQTQMNKTAQKLYLLGHVQSQVSIIAANGGTKVVTTLDWNVCGQPPTGTVTSVNPITSPLYHESSSNINPISITRTCNKYGQGTWCEGPKINFTSVGFWTVISPTDFGTTHPSWQVGDKISYNTRVSPIGPTCAKTPNPNGLSGNPITYTVT